MFANSFGFQDTNQPAMILRYWTVLEIIYNGNFSTYWDGRDILNLLMKLKEPIGKGTHRLLLVSISSYFEEIFSKLELNCWAELGSPTSWRLFCSYFLSVLLCTVHSEMKVVRIDWPFYIHQIISDFLIRDSQTGINYFWKFSSESKNTIH